MLKLTTEHVLAAMLIMYLFNLLSFVKPIVKDVVNSVVIILAIIGWFFLSSLT